MAAPTPASFAPLDSIQAPLDGFAYTPSDSTNIVTPEGLEISARGVTIQVAGNLQVTFINGVTRVIPSYALPVGARVSMQITKIWATNTTATGIFVWR